MDCRCWRKVLKGLRVHDIAITGIRLTWQCYDSYNDKQGTDFFQVVHSWIINYTIFGDRKCILAMSSERPTYIYIWCQGGAVDAHGNFRDIFSFFWYAQECWHAVEGGRGSSWIWTRDLLVYIYGVWLTFRVNRHQHLMTTHKLIL